MTNRDALALLKELLDLPQVSQRKENDGVESLWRCLASRDTASSKAWMDAYLAAVRDATDFWTTVGYFLSGEELRVSRDRFQKTGP